MPTASGTHQDMGQFSGAQQRHCCDAERWKGPEPSRKGYCPTHGGQTCSGQDGGRTEGALHLAIRKASGRWHRIRTRGSCKQKYPEGNIRISTRPVPGFGALLFAFFMLLRLYNAGRVKRLSVLPRLRQGPHGIPKQSYVCPPVCVLPPGSRRTRSHLIITVPTTGLGIRQGPSSGQLPAHPSGGHP